MIICEVIVTLSNLCQRPSVLLLKVAYELVRILSDNIFYNTNQMDAKRCNGRNRANPLAFKIAFETVKQKEMF